jgi:poly(ADP-ribose) glycohydrolase
MLQTDFSNKFIGGGSLQAGCGQEEIRFMENPECLVAMLVSQVLDDHEAIAICGTQRFSQALGYGPKLQFGGAFADNTKLDSMKRIGTVIVAIDAKQYAHKARRASEVVPEQFTEGNMLRELVKAYSGFSIDRNVLAKEYRQVATGNWGCGAFGGSPPLKALLQWLAAAKAGRGITYFSFNNPAASKLGVLSAALLKRGTTVGEVWTALLTLVSRQDVQASTADIVDVLLQYFDGKPANPPTKTSEAPH